MNPKNDDYPSNKPRKEQPIKHIAKPKTNKQKSDNIFNHPKKKANIKALNPKTVVQNINSHYNMLPKDEVFQRLSNQKENIPKLNYHYNPHTNIQKTRGIPMPKTNIQKNKNFNDNLLKEPIIQKFQQPKMGNVIPNNSKLISNNKISFPPINDKTKQRSKSYINETGKLEQENNIRINKIEVNKQIKAQTKINPNVIRIENKKNIGNQNLIQNPIQNKIENEQKENNLMINSINEYRLPKGLNDISFDIQTKL